MAVSINGTSGISGVDGSAGTPAIQGSDTNTGISFGTDEVNIVTGGSTRATVDANGDFSVNTDAIFVDASADRVGVGTNAPDSPVHIKGTGQTFPRVETTSSTNDAGWKIKNGTREWSTFVNGSDGDYRIYDETASSDQMRLASTGVSYVWNSNNSTAFIAASSVGSSATVVLAVRHSASAIKSGTDAYYIYANGSAGSASDVNLKKNIETTRDGYLEDLNRLRVVKYNWNNQEDTEPRELGLIAQEVEEVFPGLACDMKGEDENGEEITTKGIKYSVLPVMLLKALQEATAKIEALETRVAQLEGGAS